MIFGQVLLNFPRIMIKFSSKKWIFFFLFLFFFFRKTKENIEVTFGQVLISKRTHDFNFVLLYFSDGLQIIDQTWLTYFDICP
jgi:hypothetical protein